MILDICGGQHNFFGDRPLSDRKNSRVKKNQQKIVFFFSKFFQKFDRFEKNFILIFLCTGNHDVFFDWGTGWLPSMPSVFYTWVN